MILWLMGLSGAGKSTVARLVYDQVKPLAPATVLLDGDMLREVWGDNLGHTLDARRINAERVSRLCHLLDRQDINAIVAILSMFPEWQRWNRAHFSSYFEVFLDTPLGVVQERDSKGLYKGALAGLIKNVVGVDIEMPWPANPDLVLSAPEVLQAPEVLADIVLHRSGILGRQR